MCIILDLYNVSLISLVVMKEIHPQLTVCILAELMYRSLLSRQSNVILSRFLHMSVLQLNNISFTMGRIQIQILEISSDVGDQLEGWIESVDSLGTGRAAIV